MISLSSDDVSLPDGDSRGSDVMMTSYSNHDIIASLSASLLLLKCIPVKIPLCQSVLRLTFLGNKNLKCLRYWKFFINQRTW